jgi:hypothetical protein
MGNEHSLSQNGFYSVFKPLALWEEKNNFFSLIFTKLGLVLENYWEVSDWKIRQKLGCKLVYKCLKKESFHKQFVQEKNW